MASIRTLLFFFSTFAFSFAVPLKPRQSVDFSVHVSSDLSTLDGRSVNATDTGFFIGLDTAVECPLSPPGCEGVSNTTSIIVGGDGSASMDSLVPGGQIIYVKSNGILSFTEPHQESSIPDDSYTGNFNVGPENELIFSGGDSTGWYVCGDGTEPVQVFAKVISAMGICATAQDIRLFLSPVVEPGAFQYD